MYNKEPVAAEAAAAETAAAETAAAETAAAETAAAETEAAIDAPDVSEQTEDTAGVVKRKREVNGTADADVRTLQAENRHRT